MGISEIIIGSGQLVSSIVLGAMAVNYSKKVTAIESERRDLEKKNGKVNLLHRLTELQVNFASHYAESIGSIVLDDTGRTLNNNEIESLLENYKGLKTTRDNKTIQDKMILAEDAYNSVFNYMYDFNSIVFNDSSVTSLNQRDRDIYVDVLHVLELLEVRDDTGDHSEQIKIIDKLNSVIEGISIGNSHPLVYVLENSQRLIYMTNLITEVKHSIKNS